MLTEKRSQGWVLPIWKARLALSLTTRTTHSYNPAKFQAAAFVRATVENGRTVLPVLGPPDPFRRDGRMLQASIVVDVDPEEPVMRVRVDGKPFVIAQGEWSPWIPVKLKTRLGPVHGIFRLYAKELHPQLRIYRSPLNVDPSEPGLRISQPASFSRDLVAGAGMYFTQGIPEDTSAVRQGALDLNEYLAQSRIAAEEGHRILMDRLKRFRSGMLFFYFSEIDQNSHLLWERHDAELLRTYQKVDQTIGEVLDASPDGDVIVMSDHGFARFEEAVNLNFWLREQGLAARAMGLNAVYANGSDIQNLKRKLEMWRDPVGGEKVVTSVRVVGKSWSKYAPSLIVGYGPGYRASWETALGQFGSAAIVPNRDAWIGDHCVDSRSVPGVLLGTRAWSEEDAGLEDLPVTILNAYGVSPAPGMKGRNLWPSR